MLAKLIQAVAITLVLQWLMNLSTTPSLRLPQSADQFGVTPLSMVVKGLIR